MRNKGNLKIIIDVSRKGEAIMKLKEQLNPIRSKLTEGGINEDQIQETYDEFEKALRETIETYGVKRKEETTGDKITEEILQQIKKKREMWKKIGGKENSKTKIENIEIQKLVKRKIREDIKNYDNERIKEIIEDTGSIRKMMSEGKNLIRKLRNEKVKMVYSREGVVEIATRFYETLYQGAMSAEREEERETVGKGEEVPKFLWAEIRLVIEKLKINKVPGPDNIENDKLKIFLDAIIPTLAAMFDKIIEVGKIPHQWYTGEIIQLYKKRVKENIENYRPISLVSNISKIFIACLKNRMYNQLDQNQSNEQAGFRRGFSIIDNLFVTNQIIEKANEYSLPVKIIFIDFQKAFDTIYHNYLWQALKNLGYKKKSLKY